MIVIAAWWMCDVVLWEEAEAGSCCADVGEAMC